MGNREEFLEKYRFVPEESDGTKKRMEIMRRSYQILAGEGENIVYFYDINSISEYFKALGIDYSTINKQPLVLRKALELYQSECFEQINSFLRTNKGLERGSGHKLKHLKFDMSEMQIMEKFFNTEDVIDALDTLINSTTIDSDMILYRGVNADFKEFSSLNINNIEDLINSIGKKFTQFSYTSTTPVLQGRFANESPIIISIKVPKGTHFIGPLPGEGEILLERHSEYMIKDVEIIDNKYHVYVEMLPNLLEKGVEDIETLHLADKKEDIELDTWEYEAEI